VESWSIFPPVGSVDRVVVAAVNESPASASRRPDSSDVDILTARPITIPSRMRDVTTAAAASSETLFNLIPWINIITGATVVDHRFFQQIDSL
jgi:hypothetical protein